MRLHTSDSSDNQRPFDLAARAERAARDAGFETQFSPAALDQAAHADEIAPHSEEKIVDLRDLGWSSIDNEESRDLDQVEWCERLNHNRIRLLVAIADVAVKVPPNSPIDERAGHNTVSIYTGVETFPMLPERLSNQLTSLLEGEERLAVVAEMIVDEDGEVVSSDVYRARVINDAKLVYESVGDWLDGQSVVPEAVSRVANLENQLRLQWEVATRLKEQRGRNGALDVEVPEARPIVHNGRITDLEVPRKNPARMVIENFMVTANMVLARFLEARQAPSIARVVREPQRWPRIVEVARERGATLPAQADARALSAFLKAQKASEPQSFGELSLAILKLLGRGEYVAIRGAGQGSGHFGLGMHNYAHSTAPNRRFPDLVTQRIVQALLAKAAPPYGFEELQSIAARCSEREAAAQKVERLMRKVAAAAFLGDRIGDVFEAVVTGASHKGVYVRANHPSIEGRVMRNENGLDVGDKIRVRLLRADAERGHIDFERIE